MLLHKIAESIRKKDHLKVFSQLLKASNRADQENSIKIGRIEHWKKKYTRLHVFETKLWKVNSIIWQRNIRSQIKNRIYERIGPVHWFQCEVWHKKIDPQANHDMQLKSPDIRERGGICDPGRKELTRATMESPVLIWSLFDENPLQ